MAVVGSVKEIGEETAGKYQQHVITETLLRVKVASLPVAYLKQLFCGLQTLEIMVLTLSSCDCWCWLTCELIVSLFSLSLFRRP